MPKQTKKSSLAERLKSSGVRTETRTKAPVAPAVGTLPPDMTGIARLTRLDFDVMESGDYAGEQRLYAHGVCVSPKEFKDKEGNLHVTEGALVQLSKINLCDTVVNGETVEFEKNWAKAENRLKLLGIPTEDIDDSDFEANCLAYVEAKGDMFFKFRTWQPDDSDRIVVLLLGPADGYNHEVEDDVQDQGADIVEAPEEEAPAAPAKPEKAKKSSSKKAEKEPEPAPKKTTAQPSKSQSYSEDDIRMYGDKAASGDESMQTKLTDIGAELGIDVNPIPTWEEVADTIISNIQDLSDGSEESNEEEESEEIVPEKGDIFLFRDMECEVSAVFPGRKTCNLVSTEDKKTYKSIAWTSLKPLG